MRLDGVIDLECAQWTVPVVCGAYSPMRGARWWRHLPELVDQLLAWRGWWWSWAGGTYDMLAIAEELRRRGINSQVFTGGSRVTQIVCGDLRFVDAYALIPLALDRAAELVGATPPSLGWPCRCEEGCDGYCQIHERLDLDKMAELADYCLADCRVGYDVVAYILTLCAEKNYAARGTIGGTAWATAQKRLGPDVLPPAKWHWSTLKRARRGYYGGRVCIGRGWVDGGDHYDIRSAYPAALAKTAVPTGPMAELGDQRSGVAYANGVPGIYRATVRIPDSLHLPPLPWRTSLGRLAFPHGIIRGSWPAIELRAAEARGVVIEKMHSAVVWADEFPIFRELVAEWWAERNAAGPDTALGRWYRELANSITGKLAESPDRLAISMHPDMAKLVVCDGRNAHSIAGGCTTKECTGRCGAWRQLDPHGMIWGVPLYRQGSSAHVQMAAYLTAATRLAWLEGAEQLGDGFVYGHTDSLRSSTVAPANVGSQLGQWEHKGSFADWICLGPSRMCYVDARTGEVIAVASGTSKMDARLWDELRQGRTSALKVRGVQTFKEAAASGEGLFRRRAIRHRFGEDDGWRGDRKLDMSDGRTYPVSREAIEARDARYARTA